MDKKQLLIVINHLTIGGAQKSLISALKVIDYDKYDVTVYLRKNRTDLLPYVDKRAKVTVNKDNNHYYIRPYAVFLQLLIFAYGVLGKTTKKKQAETKLADKIREYRIKYEKKTYFSKVYYDKAIAYSQDNTAIFVDKAVCAREKYVFFHTSTDDFHDVHKEILPRFDGIIAEHHEQKALLSQWYPEHAHKISVIENYVDRQTIAVQSQEKTLPENDGKTVLCYCGRFAPVKGFDLAVETARILKERKIPFIWYFVGDGPERNNIEKLIEEYNLGEHIVLTGMQKNPYPYIGSCDIYVQASYEENTGITILEAQSLYKPVVTTKTLGGMKLINDGENGLVCDINATALADGIEKLIKDKTLKNNMADNLENADYSGEFLKHKEQWQNLLEG